MDEGHNSHAFHTPRNCALLTKLSSASPDATWNSDKPELAIAPPFFTRRPWLRTAARIRRSASGSSSSPPSSPRPLFSRRLLVLPAAAARGAFPCRPLTVLGVSRSANDLARCPRCKWRIWKMCFSSEGCVAYARICDAKALRAISAFCFLELSCAVSQCVCTTPWTSNAPLSAAGTTAQTQAEPQ
jgi:hypothetical protein